MSAQNLREIKLSAKKILDFTEQLDSFISAKMTIDQSLQNLRMIYEESEPNKPITKMVIEMQLQVIAGKKFSEVLSNYPHTFSRFYISMIEAGELTGNLAEIMNHLTDYLKREDELRSEVKGALTYPVILTVLGVAVTSFLLVNVVPRFEKMFQSSGQDLPIYTEVLLSISHFLGSKQGLVVVILLFVSVYVFYQHIRSEEGRRWFDKWILQVPLLGELLRRVAVARFTLTLGILLDSKIGVIPALGIGRGVVGNKVLEKALFDSSLRVNAGENMSQSLKNVFPLKAVQMLEVGELNGQLAEMSLAVSQRYEKEIRDQLRTVTAVIEPILLIVLGGIVCFIALAIFLPMMNQGQF